MSISADEVAPALSMWDGLGGASLRLINYSENHSFLVQTPAGDCFVLRLHRVGYQSRASIESELAWLTALRRDTELAIPDPVAGLNGQYLQGFQTVDGHRFAVLFRHIPGDEPDPSSNLDDLFVKLGAYAATMHRHVMSWTQPPGFERQVWQASTILDADGLWGNWRVAPGVGEGSRVVLDRLCDVLTQRLADYGTGPDRYGLIHADMRLGNLLVDGEALTLIDFDDSGFCWFAYDFAAAISFYETNPAIPALRAAWLQGYRSVRTLSMTDVEMIDSMVMLRRMALLAWIGSHAETSLAQQFMPGFADGTVQLAERYLRGPIWS